MAGSIDVTLNKNPVPPFPSIRPTIPLLPESKGPNYQPKTLTSKLSSKHCKSYRRLVLHRASKTAAYHPSPPLPPKMGFFAEDFVRKELTQQYWLKGPDNVKTHQNRITSEASGLEWD